MIRNLTALAATLALSVPVVAQEEPEGAPSPGEIVAQAEPSEWKEIPADDLLVMTLADHADGHERKVVIQLIPAPFSQGWVENIRTFARAHWYDNITVNRVQDNYVVQWGDVNYDNPEATGEAKPLPEGLKVMSESEYASTNIAVTKAWLEAEGDASGLKLLSSGLVDSVGAVRKAITQTLPSDSYSSRALFNMGWPLSQEAGSPSSEVWPVHCYGMVGVGRNLSPDTGSGAELYTVIGTPPRHLDRNIALVGRIVEGMEHLSSLPRGHGDLGFYAADEAYKRTPILSVRVASDLPEAERPRFEYLSTEGETFARYADARANRRDPFFIVPAGGADICNIPVPIRRVAE
ncbi:peptidylprolyl isomerase [Erythrobacter mangrovi]|uniref:Peptidylprolyl isomerase n=1 Tax=Erythrobacter mangrovi TaxID=2739433 RepID=A0A7D4CNM8_9SPHN|nr:peptidylprolyl isomerase [Erythrobacter mangrovi]QKG72168.1 peptidylprolyl isomerase [Erythrobacter mangrovi]